MENGSDLRNRLTILEQRVGTLSESVQQLVKIVGDISWTLSGAIGALNAEILRLRSEGGYDTRTLIDIDARLAALDETLENLGKP